ncbi:hypothetical protein ACFL5U_02875 [Candidatus Margulisiibacteriota bacterium]
MTNHRVVRTEDLSKSRPSHLGWTAIKLSLSRRLAVFSPTDSHSDIFVAVKPSDFGAAKATLSSLGITSQEVETINLKALIINEGETPRFIITHKYDSQKGFNWDVGGNVCFQLGPHGFPEEATLSAVEFIARSLVTPSRSLADVWYQCYLNSIELYTKLIRGFLRGESYHPKPLGTADYSHQETFAYLYYIELRSIIETYKDAPPRELSILDAGACSAHFPVLLNTFLREEWPQVSLRMEAVDIETTGPFADVVIRYCKEHDIPLVLKYGDIRHPFAERFDLVLANDILEHLAEADSFDAFRNLWQTTGRLFIAHVPFEDVPNPAWDHLITFSPDKLRRFGRSAKEGTNISETTTGYDGKPIINDGFLILENPPEDIIS